MDFEKQEAALLSRAAAFRTKSNESGPVTNRIVDIFSDGIRMSGTVWEPKSKCGLMPAILLCHGWGGKRAHLDFSYAVRFAEAGFMVLTFDYRGWGDSDGVLVGSKDRVQEVRKVIDPEWQMRDVDNAMNYLIGLEHVDANRIGIWGSSFGGGHALAMAARMGGRIKCVVCQIGSIDTHANWVDRHPQFKGVQAIQQLAIDQAYGRVSPWTIQMPQGLDGAPNLPKVVFEHTNNTIASLDKIQAATLILAAENEELFKNENNSEFVYHRLKGRVPAELSYLPGGHYDAYGQPAYGKGVAQALKWFQLYLTLSKI